MLYASKAILLFLYQEVYNLQNLHTASLVGLGENQCHGCITDVHHQSFIQQQNLGGGGSATCEWAYNYSMLSLEGLWDMFLWKFLDASRLLYITF